MFFFFLRRNERYKEELNWNVGIESDILKIICKLDEFSNRGIVKKRGYMGFVKRNE